MTILNKWPKNNIMFTVLSVLFLRMKFEFKQPSEFLEKDAWIWQSNMSGFGWKKN